MLKAPIPNRRLEDILIEGLEVEELASYNVTQTIMVGSSLLAKGFIENFIQIVDVVR